MTNDVEQIRKCGDLLERRIFQDEEFAREFSVYPIIWSKYVVPNRKIGTPSLTVADWMRFAERHYSCIIRCWIARSAKRDIDSLCEESVSQSTADHHLSIHRLLFDFFCSLGAAIDNMRIAFVAPPLKSESCFEEIYCRGSNSMSLKHLYERRTQFIHKSVVPCFDSDGLLSLDSSLFHDTETKWDQPRGDVRCISLICEQYWTNFVREMRAAWGRLLDLLKQSTKLVVSDQTSEVGKLDFQIRFGAGVADIHGIYNSCPGPSG